MAYDHAKHQSSLWRRIGRNGLSSKLSSKSRGDGAQERMTGGGEKLYPALSQRIGK
jgi:hypothetical protein